METYAHGLYTYALFSRRWDYALKASLFSVFPDTPYLVTFLVTWGKASLGSRDAFTAGLVYQLSSSTHSALVLGAVAMLVLFLRRRSFQPLIVGWGLHVVADMFTHVQDSTPLFWPLAGYRFPAPVSYWDPMYHGREFFWINHSAIAAIALYLVFQRVRSQPEQPLAAEGISSTPGVRDAHDLTQ